MLADIGAVVGLERLVVTVAGGVHDVDQRTLGVILEQPVPVGTPDQLDDVPAGTPEEHLKFLDDLAVAAHRPVQALQVAVDDEGEVVKPLVRGVLQRTARLDLVHLTVAQECPDALLAGVLDTAVLEVLVERSLVDRVDRADAHRHRRELPEVLHAPRMRVAGQATTAGRAAVLLTETVHVRLRQASLKEGASVHTGRGVTLEVDLVTAVRVVLAAPEVLQAHLIQGCRRGIAGDVPTDANAGTLLTMHLDGGVPAQHVTDVLLKVYVTRVGNLTGLGDGVDVVCRN